MANGNDSIYSAKTNFSFLGEVHSILAICNAIILKYGLVIDDTISDEWELVSFIREKLQEMCLEEMKDSLNDAINITGNLHEYTPKPLCNRIDSFQKSPFSKIFQILRIPLYHGWICDDEVGSSASETARVGITDSGLYTLKQNIQEHEIFVLLHEERLHTATKKDDELYLLVTDRDVSSNNMGMPWQNLNGSFVGEDFTEAAESGYVDERSVDEEVEEGSMEEAEEEGSVDEASSESMETHVGGTMSPTTVLEEVGTSSDSSDGI